MRILAISGSRNPRGQTGRATAALLEGAAERGAAVEHVLLPALRIERCRQCDDEGWGRCRTEHACVIEDDVQGLIGKVLEADVAVFATPVYYGDLAESLRALLDRFRRVHTFDMTRAGIAGKPAVGVCVAGGGGGGAPHCAVSLERTLASIGFHVFDLIPVRRQNLAMKLPLLRATGQWLAANAIPRS